MPRILLNFHCEILVLDTHINEMHLQERSYIKALLYYFSVSLQERIPLEEVFKHLRCTKDGLTSEDARERLTLFGHNKLEEKKVHNITRRSCITLF